MRNPAASPRSGRAPRPAQPMKATDATPEPAPDAPPEPGTSVREHAKPGSVTSFLLARGLDVPRESLRIVAGFGLLVVAGLAALNVTLWHNAGRRIEDEAWRRLEASTDVRRAEVDHLLGGFLREALSIAHDPRSEEHTSELQPRSGI